MTLSTHSLIHILVVSNPFPPYTPFVSLTSRPIFLCFDFPHPPFSKSGLLSQKRPIFSEKREKKKNEKKKDGKFRGVSYSLLSSWGVPQHFLKFSHSIPLFRICRPRRVGTARRKKRSRSPTIDGERGRERRNGNKKKRG